MKVTRLLLAVSVAAALMPTSAWAERSSSDGSTTIGPIHFGSETTQGSAGFDGSGTGADAASRAPGGGSLLLPDVRKAPGVSDVTLRPIPNNAVPKGGFWVDQNGTIHTLPAIPADACPQDQTGFYSYDANGAPLGIVCVGNGTAPPAAGPAAAAVELAQRASAGQPWPALQVTVNPTAGLTGLASWFWLSGDPQMPDATASAGSLTVRVHAGLLDVVWRFGDGTGLDSGSSIGQPASGRVQHVYETDTPDRSAAYTVSVLVRYRVTYSVNGGPFNLLGVKARSFAADYRVNQLQPEAVATR